MNTKMGDLKGTQNRITLLNMSEAFLPFKLPSLPEYLGEQVHIDGSEKEQSSYPGAFLVGSGTKFRTSENSYGWIRMGISINPVCSIFYKKALNMSHYLDAYALQMPILPSSSTTRRKVVQQMRHRWRC
ncbi:MAG: hypothetical protein U0T75_15285, partial [Chitinophagales bacterium]